MTDQFDATTLSPIAFAAMATPAAEPHLAMATTEGAHMARVTSGGQHGPAEGGQATSGGQPAKRAVAKKTPAKKATAATEDVHGPTGDVASDILALMASRPLAGAGMDPKLRGPRSFTLSLELIERLRAVTYWGQLANVPEAASGKVSDVAEDILREGIEALEGKYNGGRPFPQAPDKMPTGPGARGVASLQEYQAEKRSKKSGDDG